jgi:hypothetical protein
MSVEGQSGTSPKKGRGMARESLALIDAMYVEAEAAQLPTRHAAVVELIKRGLASLANEQRGAV